MMAWTLILSAVVLLSPMLAEGSDCFANETQLHVSFFNFSTRPGTTTVGLREFSSSSRVRFDLFISNDYSDELTKLPFRAKFINLTLTSIQSVIIRQILDSGSEVEFTFNGSSPRDFEFPSRPYVRRMVILGDVSSSTGTIFVEDLAYCVRVRPSIPLGGVMNPCTAGQPGLMQYSPDNTYFIQCDDFGRAFVMPCGYNTVFNASITNTSCINRPA